MDADGRRPDGGTTGVLVATVGHGSAFDIAGHGVADPTSLKPAIRQAARASKGEPS